MSKIISGLILLFTFLTIFPKISYAAVEINPDPIGDLAIDEERRVRISGLDPLKQYRFVEYKEVSPGVWPQINGNDCPVPLADGSFIRFLGPSSEVGNYKLSVFYVGSAADPIPDEECIPLAEKTLEISRFFTVGLASITGLRNLLAGEVIEVRVSGLAPNRVYYWTESGPRIYEYCFRADGSGIIDQTLGPFEVAGTYRLEIKPSKIDDLTSCSSSVETNVLDENVIVAPTVGSLCKPPRIPSTNRGTDTCRYIKREGIRALPGECPVGYQLTENDCNSGNLPFLIRTTTSFRCECRPEGAPVCVPPASCLVDSDCTAIPGCGSWVCQGAIPGRTPGRCVDSTTTCPKASLNCSTDADCHDGSVGCSKFTCWTIGRSKQCRFGTPPPPPPPPGIPVTSGGETCGTPENPGFKTAIGCIHTNPEKFVQDLLKFTIAISGGLAFLLMLLGAFQMLTSAGNPETLHSGRERFTNAIIGLLFIIFAILLLQVIGVDILGLRELGK